MKNIGLESYTNVCAFSFFCHLLLRLLLGAALSTSKKSLGPWAIHVIKT